MNEKDEVEKKKALYKNKETAFIKLILESSEEVQNSAE